LTDLYEKLKKYKAHLKYFYTVLTQVVQKRES